MEYIVGIDFHLDKLKSIINNKSNEVCMIGIYRIGDIGKTTIAKAICNNSISYQFDGWSFLENIREVRIGMYYFNYNKIFLMISLKEEMFINSIMLIKESM